MKRLIFLFFFFSFLNAPYSQPYDAAKINKKAITLYDQAMVRASDGNLTLAAGLLLQAIQIDGSYVDAYLSLAGVYGELKSHSSSTEYYEKAFALDPDYTMDYKLPYSINLAAQGKFEKALNAINELLEKKPPKNSNSLKAAQYRKRCFEFAVDYDKKNAGQNYIFTPVNAGNNINSTSSEYFPSLTIDGKELIFTRKLGNINEDFYFSDKAGNDWTKAGPVKGSVNTEMNEGAQNISLDGQMLVFTACDRPDGMGSCDIYISYLGKDGWTEAANAGRKINSDQWDSQPCLSPDKKDLYFSSRRLGGYGGCDIYVSHLQANGKWGDPENLGPGVNTSGDEQCPFMHADNQTFYFTSNFWPGYGEGDLFYIRKGPNSSWSKPVNLGYPINTITTEGTLFITADGSTAYYSSDKSDSKGGLDIYHFELREDVRPYRTLWVRGQVFDQKTGKGLPSSVELIDLSTKQTINNVQTDEQGKYLITLPVGKDYAFNVNRKGYLFYSGNFSLSQHAPDSTYEKNIPLQPIEVNASVVLNNIFFDVNKFDLKPESQVELDKVVQLLNDNPTVKVEIDGYTDNVGKPAENLVLSNNRAKTVVAYLLSKQISQQRLTFKGFGESKPRADNGTEEGRAMNRRTEMKVTVQ